MSLVLRHIFLFTASDAMLFLFAFSELSVKPELMRQLVPPYCEAELASRSVYLDNFVPIPLEQMRISLD